VRRWRISLSTSLRRAWCAVSSPSVECSPPPARPWPRLFRSGRGKRWAQPADGVRAARPAFRPVRARCEPLLACAKGCISIPSLESKMQSRFVEHEAEAMVDRYGARGVPRDLALRVYTTRLLGGDPRLVLHGGGNTSVKLRLPDRMGREVDVLCVKGSGADMAVIEPAGL